MAGTSSAATKWNHPEFCPSPPSCERFIGSHEMTEVERLARFVDERQFGDIGAEARQQLKIRVLDTIGVAIGALDAPPILAVSRLIDELGGRPLSTLIGGGKTAPD